MPVEAREPLPEFKVGESVEIRGVFSFGNPRMVWMKRIGDSTLMQFGLEELNDLLRKGGFKGVVVAAGEATYEVDIRWGYSIPDMKRKHLGKLTGP